MRNRELRLVERYIIKRYKDEMIWSTMITAVINHESEEVFGIKLTQLEIDYLISKLRFKVSGERLRATTKVRNEDIQFYNDDIKLK